LINCDKCARVKKILNIPKMALFSMGIFSRKTQSTKNDFIHSGSTNLDYLLGGGFPSGLITQIYGSAGSGKTNICMSAAVQVALNGNEIAYIDTENSFNKFRFEQLAGEKAAEIAKRIYLYNPRNLSEQRIAIEKLGNFMDENFSLIVIDSFVSLYRLELRGGREKILPFGRELGKQLSILANLARDYKCAVLITNQVYDSFTDEKELEELMPAGGDALDYWSKIILWIEKQGKDRLVTLIKHSFREDGESIKLKITKEGIG